jgi:hypothetical protein
MKRGNKPVSFMAIALPMIMFTLAFGLAAAATMVNAAVTGS